MNTLEFQLAAELKEKLLEVPVGAAFTVQPSDGISYSLELYIPRLLREHFSEWKTESIDGIFVAYASKTAPGVAQLTGTCILIRDQTVTPFLLDIALSSMDSSVEVRRLVLGEPGGGAWNIRGTFQLS